MQFISETKEATAGREALIERLREAGATDEQIRAAIEHDRLALLPAELLLSEDCLYTIDDAAELSGIDPAFLVRHLVATGMVRPRPGELCLRLERVARVLRDDLAAYLAATMETHLRERIEREALSRAEVEAGVLPGARQTAVCFADLVEFTRLSDQAGSEQVTEIATAFADLAAEVAEPPVRLVKLIGDAAMLVSAEPEPLVAAAFALREGAQRAGLPELRIGVALGPALERLGDWYGRTVNLASRLTAAAPVDAIVASPEVAARLGEAFTADELGKVTLKGLAEPVAMCRLRRA